MFDPKKQVSDFSYTPAILHDLHLFYMKTSFLQENKVSDFHIHSLPIKMYGICQVSHIHQNLHAFYKVSDSLRIRKRGEHTAFYN